jgi:hypothetical protein
MGTEGNALTQSFGSGSVGNAILPRQIEDEEVTDPTLGNGDGTYSLTVSDARQIDSEEVLGVEWDGSQRARLDSVSDSTVVVVFEEPDGSGSFATTADGTISGTLTVRVLT